MMLMKAFSILCLRVFLLTFFTPLAYAQNGGWVYSDHMRMRILSHVDSIGDTRALHAGLDIELADGWHTYWRVPGDTGLPPRFAWGNSRNNIEDVTVHFPSPKRKNEQGFITFGLDGRFMLPLDIALVAPETETELSVQAQFMICKDICIPQRLNASLLLEPGTGEKSSYALQLERAREKLPHRGNSDTLSVHDIHVAKDRVSMRVEADQFADNFDVFVVMNDTVGLTAVPEIEDVVEHYRDITVKSIEPMNPADDEISVTVVNGNNAIHILK